MAMEMGQHSPCAKAALTQLFSSSRLLAFALAAERQADLEAAAR